MPVKITGIPGGDCECFCFHVTEEEYRRVVGDEEYQREVADRDEQRREYEANGISSDIVEQGWRIYPDDILRALGVEDRSKPVTLEIGVV